MTTDSLMAFRAALLRLAAEPTRRPVAGGIVVNRAGQVVLVYSSFAGQGWHFPKGGLDEGEGTLEAALKETHEEAGVEVRGLDLPPLDLGPGGTFHDVLAFGSPRGQPTLRYHSHCHYFDAVVEVHGGEPPGERISQGALDLLRQASHEVGFGEEEFQARRYELFDACRNVPVCWRQHPVYHVLAFARRAPEHLTGESEQVRWWSLEELSAAVHSGTQTIHRNVARLLPDLAVILEPARQQAREDG
jgi:8-oxo-dGTP pyrophosphatase MutT (NUDIX family)